MYNRERTYPTALSRWRRPIRMALSLLFAITLDPATAQQNPERHPLHFDRLPLEIGFSGPFIEAITRDSRGFLWTAGQRGLDRYDGLHIRAYGPTTPGLTPGIQSLVPDPTHPGGLWIVTKNGLSRFDPSTEQFTALDVQAPPRHSSPTAPASGSLRLDVASCASTLPFTESRRSHRG